MIWDSGRPEANVGHVKHDFDTPRRRLYAAMLPCGHGLSSSAGGIKAKLHSQDPACRASFGKAANKEARTRRLTDELVR